MDTFGRKLQDATERIALLQQYAQTPQAPGEAQDLLRQAIQELDTAFEELRVSQEELREQNEELITARAVIEAERQRYRDLFDFAPDAYLVTTPEGVIRKANRAAVNLLRIAPRFLVKKPLLTFVAPQDRPALREMLAQLRTVERVEDWELLLTPRRGDPIAAALTVASVRGSAAEAAGLHWLVRDISERRRSETERYRQLVEEVEEYAIFLLDNERRVLSWNRGAERIFGYSAAQMLGQSADIVFTDEDRAQRAPEQEQQTAFRAGRAADERWHVRKDGTRFWGSGVLTALRGGPHQSVRGYGKVLRDLTERKRAEEALEKALQTEQTAREALEARVAARTTELARANTLLRGEVTERSRSEKARGELVRQLVTAQEEERRRISREMHDQTGQHLTGLTLGLRTLADALQAGSPPPAGLLTRLQEIADELARETHQLSVELRPPALDDLGLSAALHSLVDDWMDHHGVQADLHFACPKRQRLPAPIETVVYRVVQEALTNIVKHARARRVGIIVERLEGALSVIIEDDGVGFDIEATLASPEATHRLGLLGMQERAALAGGTLTIESSPGKGTALYLRLPLSRSGG